MPGHFGRQHFANIAILSPILHSLVVRACHLYSSHRERTESFDGERIECLDHLSLFHEEFVDV
jgi:hypothetical protein